MMEEMERIISIYKNPKNYGEIDNADIKKVAYNASCGDMISIYLKVENNIIKDVKFKSKACAICTASASLLSENIKNKKLDEVEKLNSRDVLKLLGIDLSKNPSRIKCALLPLEAIKEGIKEYKNAIAGI